MRKVLTKKVLLLENSITPHYITPNLTYVLYEPTFAADCQDHSEPYSDCLGLFSLGQFSWRVGVGEVECSPTEAAVPGSILSVPQKFIRSSVSVTLSLNPLLSIYLHVFPVQLDNALEFTQSSIFIT